MQREKVGEGPMHVEDIGNNIIHEAENDVGSNGKYKLKRKRGRKNLIETNVGESQRSNVNKAVRQKICIEWTDYLHEKFMKAVRQLGEGNCYPKNILEVMGVPNLTRMQVASHLQVQPHHLTFGNSFNNPFFPVQNNIGGGIHQYGPFFGMPGSQGLQGPIIGNINSMPNLEFNRGSHHTQSIYSLDLNNMANHNHGPPSATLPNEQGRGFDQVYFDDLSLSNNPMKIGVESQGVNAIYFKPMDTQVTVRSILPHDHDWVRLSAIVANMTAFVDHGFALMIIFTDRDHGLSSNHGLVEWEEFATTFLDRTSMLIKEMELSKIMVHAQKIEEEKYKERERENKSAITGRATNPDDEDLGDEELLNPRRIDEVATPGNRRDHQARFRPECRAVQIPFEDDDDDLDGAGATGAIIPPPLAPEAKCNITSTMIQLLQLKGLFGGLTGDDPNMHLINFISICKSFDNPGVGQNAIRLCLFPLSLFGEATLWLNGLTPDSITNWRQLKDAFIERFYPPSKRAQLRDEISNFRQLPTEALHET
ncbi:hypothetical protein CQW23_21263 [Capsicum baccatum]|uniref:HTH myb-type domain-containing protein n=1 Tax=Capsicum baccatum TaxID=33114 RepID=A0A2G2VXI4_CAPBA|nr:hypothetical protein CQW23_21263 [Capsicum baccatum]